MLSCGERQRGQRGRTHTSTAMNAIARAAAARAPSLLANPPGNGPAAETFDAVVGRYVLVFNPNPAAMLRIVARLVRSGGVIVFHEPDWNGSRSNPVAPMYEQCSDWIVQTFKKVGTNPYMGQDLPLRLRSSGHPSAVNGASSANRRPLG
jgi:hypothetical protein